MYACQNENKIREQVIKELGIPEALYNFLTKDYYLSTPEEKEIINDWIPGDQLKYIHRCANKHSPTLKIVDNIIANRDLNKVKEIFQKHKIGSVEKWYAVRRYIALSLGTP